LWVAPGLLAVVAPADVHAAFVRRFPEEMTAGPAVVLLFLLPTAPPGPGVPLEAHALPHGGRGPLPVCRAPPSPRGLAARAGGAGRGAPATGGRSPGPRAGRRS